MKNLILIFLGVVLAGCTNGFQASNNSSAQASESNSVPSSGAPGPQRPAGATGAPGSSTIPGVFYVTNYASIADAFAAAASAGGGTVFFAQSATLTEQQEVGSNISIQCANTGVVISTSSNTADLFYIDGTYVTVENCGLAFSGTPGAKTAGSLLDIVGNQVTVDNVVFGPYCFICITNNSGAINNFSNLSYLGNLTAAPASGSAMFLCSGGGAQIVNLSSSANAGTNNYTYGVAITNCAANISNSEILQAGSANVALIPGSGQAAFLTLTGSYLDTCAYSCLLLQPLGGTIGYVEASSNEMGCNGVCFGIWLDQSSSGAIGQVHIANNEVFNYVNGQGIGLNISGAVGNTTVTGNTIGGGGTDFLAGFDMAAGSSCSCTVTGNSLSGTTDGLYVVPTTTTSLITDNQLNGTGEYIGSNSSANIFNNLP